MSIEQALADNTAAIHLLIAAMGNALPAAKATPVATAKATKPAPTQPTAEVVKDAAPEPKEEPSAPSVDYPTLQKAVFALAGKSRDAAAAVAASFSVKTFKELGQDKWAAALAAVNAKLAELEAA